MGFFRFRRSFRIAPGIRLNLSKTGISTSLGRKGLTVNLRGDKVKTTVGLPGTGLSYSTTASTKGDGAASPDASASGGGGLGLLLAILAVLLAVWVFF